MAFLTMMITREILYKRIHFWPSESNCLEVLLILYSVTPLLYFCLLYTGRVPSNEANKPEWDIESPSSQFGSSLNMNLCTEVESLQLQPLCLTEMPTSFSFNIVFAYKMIRVQLKVKVVNCAHWALLRCLHPWFPILLSPKYQGLCWGGEWLIVATWSCRAENILDLRSC